MPSPFEDDTAARELLERMRWPNGPRCPRRRCVGQEPEVFLIGGEKHSHREGLYHCKRCRKSFTITVGTVFERQRVPLSTWVRAAYVFSRDTGRNTSPLTDIQFELRIAYRTVLRMRDIIEHAVDRYRGNKSVFGGWPRSLMKHQRENPAKTIKPFGTLAALLPPRTIKAYEVARTDRLLQLLLSAPTR